MLLDIIILPPKGFRAKFGQISRKIQQDFPAIFAVDNKKLIPHLSLFHIRTNQIKNISEVVGEIIKGFKSIKIIPSGFKTHTTKSGFESCGLSIQPSNILQTWHEATVYSLYKLKTGPAFKPQKYYTKKQELYRTKYGGNPNMLEFYSPHLTLAKLPKQDAKGMERLKSLLKVNMPPFRVSVVVIAKVDDNHQVVKIIKEFKLN